jgi:hypothetical protein
MEQRSISGLIKEVPAWHLLQRASDLSKIALVLQKGGLCEMKCGACLAEDIIYSALEAFYNPGRAGEANQFDMRHFFAYLHSRVPEESRAAGLASDSHWYICEIIRILLALNKRKNQEDAISGFDEAKFLGDWADFLLAEIHFRRTQS